MRILFAGTPEFAATHLKGLLAHAQTNDNKIVGVITQPDKPGKRGKQAIPSEVKKVAQAAGIPCEQPNKLQFTDIEAYQADLLIVVAYGQILRSDVLNGPRFGCINVHGSLLPRWRGAAPIQRAIEAGDTQTGINVIQMDKGLDTGDVLYSKAMPIGASTTAKTLSDALAPLGVEGLLSVISQIEQNTLQPLPQPIRMLCMRIRLKRKKRSSIGLKPIMKYQPKFAPFILIQYASHSWENIELSFMPSTPPSKRRMTRGQTKRD